MNETFMEFLKTLVSPVSTTGGGYNPEFLVNGSGGNTAAPWWARSAFATQQKPTVSNPLPTTTSDGNPLTPEQIAFQKPIEWVRPGVGKTPDAKKYTNDRDRVAAKIVAASRKWKLPTTSPLSIKPGG